MRLAIYPGSFNPYHLGHHNILLKAEAIFDKVIIARGINPEKPPSDWELPTIIKDRDVVSYSGLLTDCVKEISSNYKYRNYRVMPTVIRGLRNSVDLQFEMNQYRYIQELMPDFQMVSIFCDKEYEHISSSGIRLLSKYGMDKVQQYLLK